ncbi:YfhO family protein [Methylosinus sp. Ce-a6]|uniref:YfhO family protein n=1 Tax=Methylosinus sp. Ce-a6 TaxID=2172005 RepID=UPI0013581E82|nr:YfhO family protein [Methylosinus sp. Ce-a6]
MSISDRPLGLLGAEETPLALAETRRALAGPDGAHAHIWTRRDALAAFAAIALFMALAAGMWLASGAVVPWDSKNHFYPMFRFLGEALRRGDIPLWNPYHFAGHPSVADPQSLIFTPTFFLFALLRPAATMQEFDVFVLAHLLMGGAGVLALCARRGFVPSASVLAGLIFMLGGVAASRLQHTGMIISYSFFPLALLMLEVMLERPRLIYGIGFGILASLMALGRDQVAYLFCLVLVARFLHAAALSRRPLDYLFGRWPALLVAAATGGAILVPPVLLTLQFLATSNRPGIAFGVAAAGSLAPVNLATLLAPDIFGSLDKSYAYWGPGYDTMAAPDWTDRAIDYLFIGAAPVVLGFWHGLAGGRSFAEEMRFVHYMLAAALIYTLGRWTPFFAAIYDFFPGVSLYRRPADGAFVLNAGFALSAAYLLHRYVVHGAPRPFQKMPRALAHCLSAATVGVVLALILGGLAFSFANGHGREALVAVAVALAMAGAVAAALRLGEKFDKRGLVAVLLVMATGGELLWRNAADPLNAEPATRYSILDEASASERGAIAALRKDISERAAKGERPRVEILGLPGGWQNASMILGLEDTLGYNPLRIADYERAVGPGDNAVDPNLRHYPGTFRGYKCKLARLLGLDYLVLGRPLARMPRHMPRPNAAPIFVSDQIYVYKLGRAAPRAYFATRVAGVDSDAAISDDDIPEFDGTREALVDQSDLSRLDPALADPARAGEPEGKATIVSYESERIVVDVESDRDGLLVLHDLYYPGWEARVDGSPAPIVKANILFRGVPATKGRHRIEFQFRPFSIANLASAAATLLDRREE